MDKKTLLENGLLEQYVLGELGSDEQWEIAQLLKTDPELRRRLDAIESDFEHLGLENAVSPPPSVKSQLLTSIKRSEQSKERTLYLKQPKPPKFYLGIAASIAALLMLGSFWMYAELNSVKKELQTVEGNNSDLNTTIEKLNSKLESTNALFATITHPDTKQYILTGNTRLPEAQLVSYVNHNTKSVIVNTERLPQLDDDKDYQMWADVEGEMINMGIINKKEALVVMNYIDRAESLNITIEPAGGNDHPTVSNLISNIYLR